MITSYVTQMPFKMMKSHLFFSLTNTFRNFLTIRKLSITSIQVIRQLIIQG